MGLKLKGLLVLYKRALLVLLTHMCVFTRFIVWPDVLSLCQLSILLLFALGVSFIFNPVNVVLCMLTALTVQLLEIEGCMYLSMFLFGKVQTLYG